MPYTAAELDFLFAHPQAIAHARSFPLTQRSKLADVAELRHAYGGFARCLVELVTAQRAAGMKIPGGENWMLDSPSAQQATPGAVAQMRAQHLRSLGVETVADVTCSVGTELAFLQREGIAAMGADLDFQRLRMARTNVGQVPLVQADALRPVYRSQVVIADPARRDSSGRIHSIKDVQPPLPELFAAYRGRELAVKCAPGLDFADVSPWAGQIDVVSVDGSVKEACVYTPGLRLDVGEAGPGFTGDYAERHQPTGGEEDLQVLRRAVVIRGQHNRTVCSTMPFISDDADAAGPTGRYLFDLDGAIVRAGLVRQVAYAHGLWQLDPRIAYLTGDKLPADALGLRAFEIVEQVPLKKLKATLSALGVTRLEILVRGVELDPDALRKKLKLQRRRGQDHPASVVVTRVGSTATAFVCREVSVEE